VSAVRFLHTGDWHIGKSFAQVHDPQRRGVLVQARLDVIARIAALAREHGVADVLVAGDVFDAVDVGQTVLRQPLERMRATAPLRWHLIAGNHDPDRPGGPFDRIARLADLPANVLLHRIPAPVALDPGGTAVLLPAPLHDRAQDLDPTAWMDRAPTPDGVIRIGLAHGPVTDFRRLHDSERQAAHNLIDPDRPGAAALDYLALGDWHAPLQIGPRAWYSGTPEADGFSGVERGQVLLVEIEAAGAPPVTTTLPVGAFVWRSEEAILEDESSIDALLHRLRAAASESPLAELCLRLRVGGSLSLQDRAVFEDRVVAWLESALALLRLDDAGLLDAPAPGDLDAIAGGGAVRLAAERLHAHALDGPDRDLACAALRLLYREQRSVQAR
jgi:DNA repair exonuclease SbcCD nuclease subunit